MATEAEYNTLILYELGNVLAGAPLPEAQTAALMEGLSAIMTTVWSVARSRATIKGTLPWYVRREAIDVLLGQLRSVVDADLGPLNVKQSHLFRNLMEMRKAAQEEIVRVELRASKSYPPTVGPSVVTAPREVATPSTTFETITGARVATVEQTAGAPDPNDPAYTGSPIDPPPGTDRKLP